MPRIVSIQTPGSYTLRRDGALTGTFSAQKKYELLVRADPTPGARDGEWIHPTSYSASKVDQFGPYGRWTKGRNQYDGDLWSLSPGSNMVIGYTVPSYRPHLLARAIIDARQKLADDGFNALQNFAERQQAIDLIGDRLFSLGRAYRAARRKRWREAFRHLGLHRQKVARRLSENILAWNYGAKPLIDDVDKAIQMVLNPRSLQPMLGVKGKAKEGDLQSYKYKEDSGHGYVPAVLQYSELCSARCVMFVNPKNAAAIRAAALRVNNSTLLAYELTPYSFLLDWVVDVGGWLDAMGAIDGWEFYSGYTMERCVCQTFYTGTADAYGESDILGHRKLMQFRRVRLTAFPVPGWPGFKNPFSLIHALNAIALIGART